MKLKKLTIHNIASIEQAEIDFDKGSIAEDPLFLITGRTGAGKSTILNAICLALYDAVPCLTGVKDDRIYDDTVRISSPAQLMRKGTRNAEVTLSIDCGNISYLAVWEAHYSNRKSKGENRKLLMSRRLINLATGETLTKKGDINVAIHNAVGLTFEQFTRTTMLAQGQFAAFMRADEKDKADILEKLTGTGIYTRIGQTVFEMMKKAENEYSRLAADISEIKLLGDDDKQRMTERKEALKSTVTITTLRISVIDRQLEWLKARERLLKTLEVCVSESEKTTAIINSDEYKDKVAMIERYDSTSEIRMMLKSGLDMEKHIADLVTGLNRYGQNTARRIADGICHIEDRISQIRKKCEEIDARFKDLLPRVRVYADIQRIDEKASGLRSMLDKYTLTQRQVNETAMALSKSQNKETPLVQKSDDIEKEISQLDRQLKDIATSISKHDRAKLITEKKEVDDRILMITRTLQLLETLESRRSDLADAIQRETRNAEALKTMQDDLMAISAEMPTVIAEYDRCHAFLEGQKTISDHIGQLRIIYSESHKCPLCGNPHAEILPDDTISDMLNKAKEKTDDANRRLVDAKARQRSLKSDIEKMKKSASELIDEVKRKRELENNAVAELTSVGCDNPDNISSSLLKEESRILVNRSKEYETKISDIDRLMSEHGALIKKKESVTDSKDEIQKKLQKQIQETTRLTEKLTYQRQQLLDTNASVDHSIMELSELTCLKLTVDTFKKTVDTLKGEADVFQKLKDSLKECETEVETLTKTLDGCMAIMPDATTGYIEGYVSQPVRLDNPEIEISEFGNTLSRRAGEIATCKAQLAEMTRKTEAFFSESDLTCGDVDEIGKVSATKVSRWKMDIKEANENLTRAEGALKAVNQQIAEHDSSKPQIDEDATVDSLMTEKEECEKDRDAAKEQRMSITHILDEDARLHNLYDEKIRQREAAALQLNEWCLLNSVFGNSDGSRFRTISQSYVLRALLSRANQYLTWLSGRYTLDCRDGSLAIDVIDLNHGNTVRNVSLLSGGESFVVSLALALALSAISKDKIDVDILFIDEGFGTLDHDTLDTVIETLDSLHRRGGRRIGIISHVAELAERIPTQIRLVPSGPSSSRVVTT